jgi:antitoxin HigA-1
MVAEERVTSRPSRRPAHPGGFLARNIIPALEAKGMTMVGIAKALGIPRQALYAILAERRSVTPDMAARLGKALGNAPAFWLNMQANHDLWDSERKPAIKAIKRLEVIV